MTATTTAPVRPDEGHRDRGHATTPRVRKATKLIPGLVLSLAVLAVLAVFSIAVGARTISPGVVLDTIGDFNLFHAISAQDVMAGLPQRYADDTDRLVILTLRVPRTLLGLMVGAALGLAGCVMQGVTRNPLADPGILGINSGAALSVVLAITFFGVGTPGGYVWFAFVGAAVAAVIVYGIAALGREGATPIKLALAGAALSAGFAAVTQAFLLLNKTTFDQMRFWQVGALAGRELGMVGQLAPFLLIGCLLAPFLGRTLNTLSLGDDVARGLGARVGLSRAAAAAVVVLLCGAATAAAGPIGFVGLTIPHVARMITGPDYRWTLPFSMVLAPILLLGADIVGRVIARPGEVQVAIVTAVIGAPVFIALVRRKKLAEL
ncbi:FecCD family ABC transporter permease [Microlunatus soli]|uniref:Iron complex transport system permease protein n=1 Tax=Microlunatus soli TaxID=630515 RepID=A0A1H1SWF2_9ACTN|nr:iron chelate uptake ABC transporter family permease subunit [Microlunatus soli]SDS52261.1 iron complex transport system permease protein [Microlunatus soli]